MWLVFLEFDHIMACVGKGGQVWMGKTDRAGIVIYLADRSMCVCLQI